MCLDAIVKLVVIWPAEEQTLYYPNYLLAEERHPSDSLISFVEQALNLTCSPYLGAFRFTPLMVTRCINIGPDAYLTPSFLKCRSHLFFFSPGSIIQIIDESGLLPQSSLPQNLNFGFAQCKSLHHRRVQLS